MLQRTALLCAIVSVLIVSACETPRSTQPDTARGPVSSPAHSVLQSGCPRITVPTENGQTNGGYYRVVNVACGAIMGYHQTGGTGDNATFVWQSLNAGQSSYFSGRWCFVTVWNDYPKSGGTCFTGPPVDGQSYPIEVRIFSGPISPRYDALSAPYGQVRPAIKIWKQPSALPRFNIPKRGSAGGVRG